jgi:hypothetical protein
MEPTTVLCDVVFHFAGSTARVTFPLARADAYILRTLSDPREMLAEELARYRVALDCVIEISVHRKNAPDWRWSEPRDLTLVPPAPEAPGREARAGTRLGVEPERGPSSRQALADCPCGDHERSRACCAWACSDLHTPAERAAAFLAETERVAASARKPLPPPPRSVAGAAPRAPLTAWVASWVLPCELDVPKLTYHAHRHVRHGYQVITLHTFEATGMGSLYHCGRLVRTGRVAELVEYADTIADQETP